MNDYVNFHFLFLASLLAIDAYKNYACFLCYIKYHVNEKCGIIQQNSISQDDKTIKFFDIKLLTYNVLLNNFSRIFLNMLSHRSFPFYPRYKFCGRWQYWSNISTDMASVVHNSCFIKNSYTLGSTARGHLKTRAVPIRYTRAHEP